MNKPLVSVVVPVYNTGAYVEQAVRSVMDQTLRDIEIIVIDDGSTDDSPDVVARLAAKDARITVYTQPNKGLSEARNAGFSHTQGEFVYFMDSDDLLEEDTLACCYERCETDRLDFVFFDAVSFGAPESQAAWFDYRRAKYFKNPVYHGAQVLGEMLDRNCFRASACMIFIRASFLRENGFDFYPGILHEDELFTPRLFLSSQRVGGIERTFFRRRVREGSIMSNNFSVRNLNGYLTVIDELNRFAENRDSGTRRIVRRLTALILMNVFYKIWDFPVPMRWQVVTGAVRKYPRSVSPRLLLLALFKKPVSRLLRRTAPANAAPNK